MRVTWIFQPRREREVAAIFFLKKIQETGENGHEVCLARELVPTATLQSGVTRVGEHPEHQGNEDVIGFK